MEKDEEIRQLKDEIRQLKENVRESEEELDLLCDYFFLFGKH